jgi:hypothetical protein
VSDVLQTVRSVRGRAAEAEAAGAADTHTYTGTERVSEGVRV